MLVKKITFPFNLDQLKKIYAWAKSKNLSFILYRLPVDEKKNSKNAKIILSLKGLKKKKITTLEKEEIKDSIFVFTDFFSNQKKTSEDLLSFFEYDMLIDFARGEILYKENQSVKNLVDELSREVDFSLRKGIDFYSKEFKAKSTAKINFIEQVKKTLSEIKKNPALNKVVLSKTKVVKSDADPLDFFFRLFSQYENALLSLVSSAETGTWLGASPELLVKKDAAGMFETLALAGTYLISPEITAKKKIKKNDLLKTEAIWSSKEVAEQAYVSRDVINAFKKIRLREFQEIGPINLRIGNLIHLATTFKVDLKVNSKKQYSSGLPFLMLKNLHPTSAVCGFPRQAALEVIHKTEEHAREYYTGYLGPIEVREINSEVSSEVSSMESGESKKKKCLTPPNNFILNLYVNLRCCQIFSSKEEPNTNKTNKKNKKRNWVFYTGVGLTEDSSSEAEWLESEAKVEILKKFLKSNKEK